uniref:Neurobeachin-like protein 1 isoform X1 n=1 Tax=Petromyzon marinus TaxID=7757 RepID=A0AAJ7TAW0_PETMA|nr:neurobeachin-like protein 1 isoform X1 [Petromyzon marinus]
MASQERLYELWMLYFTKKDLAYLRQWLEIFVVTHEASTLDQDVILMRGDPRPPDLSVLPASFLQVSSQQLVQCVHKLSVCLDDEHLSLALLIIKALIALCRNVQNVEDIGACSYISHVITLATMCIQQSKEQTKQREVSGELSLETFALHSLHLCQRLYDPYQNWARRIAGDAVSAMERSRQRFKAAPLINEFVPFFYQCFQEYTHLPGKLTDQLLHLFGAVIAGNQRNALQAISPATLEVLMRLLVDPAMAESSGSVARGRLGLTLKCLTEMVQALHTGSPDQRQVEVASVLDGYFKVLNAEGVAMPGSLAWNDGLVELQMHMLRSIPEMLACSDRPVLQASFLNSNCFEHLTRLLHNSKLLLSARAKAPGKSEKELANSKLQLEQGPGKHTDALTVLTIRVLTCVMHTSPAAKEVFKERIGYNHLFDLLQSLGQPSLALLYELLDMAVEGDHRQALSGASRMYGGGGGGVANVQALLMLVRWLPMLESLSARSYLAAALHQLCCADRPSRTVCVNAGMMSCILDSLQMVDPVRHMDCAVSLVGLLEALGSQSIRAKELFCLFRLLRIHASSPTESAFSSDVPTPDAATAAQSTSSSAASSDAPPAPALVPVGVSARLHVGAATALGTVLAVGGGDYLDNDGSRVDEGSAKRRWSSTDGFPAEAAHPLTGTVTRALSAMARRDGVERAMHYFDLTHAMAGITVPAVQRWPGSGFSFHAWFCLDATEQRLAHLAGGKRKQLYSFFTSSGTGFEAFVTGAGVLVVAVCTKKEYVTVSLPDTCFHDSAWHCVAVVHTTARRALFSQCIVNIYVNGQLRDTAPLKFPPMGEAFTSCCIGSAGNRTITPTPSQIPEPTSFFPGSPPHSCSSTSFSTSPSSHGVTAIPSPISASSSSVLDGSPTRPSAFPGAGLPRLSSSSGVPRLAPGTAPCLRTIPAGTQDSEWGSPTSLRGQLGSVSVFHDALQPPQVKALYQAGPNNLFPFKPPECAPELTDLPAKMLLYYTPKACQKLLCLDLAPSHLFDGRLTGQTVVNWDIKDVIHCMGGMAVLVPLLEQLVSTECPAAQQDDGGAFSSPARTSEARLEGSHVACFLLLLRNFVRNHPANQESLAQSQGMATVGALILQSGKRHMDASVLTACQLLVEAVIDSNALLLHQVYQALLFDFRLWSQADFPVRIGHIQYLSTIIKDNHKQFRRRYGVQFLLDVVRTYYGSRSSELCADDLRVIRAAIFGLIKYYITKEVSSDEVQSIINFLASVGEEEQINACLDMLLALLRSKGPSPSYEQLVLLLTEAGQCEGLYSLLLLQRKHSDVLREKLFRLFLRLLRSERIGEKSKQRLRLRDGLFAGLVALQADMPVTLTVVRGMLLIIVTADTSPNYQDIMAVVHFSRKADLSVRHAVCKKVFDLVYNSHDAIQQIARCTGWQDTLVRLLAWESNPNAQAMDTASPTDATPPLGAAVIPEGEVVTRADGDKGPRGHHKAKLCRQDTLSSTWFIQRNGQAEEASEPLSRQSGDPGEASDLPTRARCQGSFSFNNGIVLGGGDGAAGASDGESDSLASLSYQPHTPFRDSPFDLTLDSPLPEGACAHGAPQGSRGSFGAGAPAAGGGGGSGSVPSTPSPLDTWKPFPGSVSRQESSLSDAFDESLLNEEFFSNVEQSVPVEEDLCDLLVSVLFSAMWHGVEGSDETAWRERGQVFTALTKLGSRCLLLRPPSHIKRCLLELMLEACVSDVRDAALASLPGLADNALRLLRLVQDHLITEGQACPEFWSLKVMEGLVTLLDTLSGRQASLGTPLDLSETTHISQRLLLGFIAHSDTQVCATAAAKLHTLLQTRPLSGREEAGYLLGRLDDALSRSAPEHGARHRAAFDTPPPVGEEQTSPAVADHAVDLNRLTQRETGQPSSRPGTQDPDHPPNRPADRNAPDPQTDRSAEEGTGATGSTEAPMPAQGQCGGGGGGGPMADSFVVPMLHALLERCHKLLALAQHLPGLPVPNGSPTCLDDFQVYCRSTEWRLFVDIVVLPLMNQFEMERFAKGHDRMSCFWNSCFDALMGSSCRRDHLRNESQRKFQDQVVEPFRRRTRGESARFNNSLKAQAAHLTASLRQWRLTRRYLSSERGPWADPEASPIHWRLASAETDSDMRLKLEPNLSFRTHRESSALRDNHGAQQVSVPADSLSLVVVKEAKVDEVDEDKLEDEEEIAPVAPLGTGEGEQSQKEKLVLAEECQLIKMVDAVPGRLELTTHHVYFYDLSGDKEEGMGLDFKCPLWQLREVHLRRYNLRRSALEIFFIDQTSYFLNFTKEVRNRVYSRIVGLRPPNLVYYGSRSPQELLKASGITQKWVNREISNFEYLMKLNTIAGRTYNDLAQYPVFPWVLSDYTSDELDLSNPGVFRDLSKPIGIVSERNAKEVKDRYENFEDTTGTTGKFHYGTHYSNAAGVMHYMIRVEPLTTLHIQLQSGRFDCADRQFHSIPATWQALMDSPNDVKELIPEFFYFPEFLENQNGFDLGTLQMSRETVNNVVLPRWAKSPDDFIRKHRAALESEFVSAHLHEWIDLIFGYKQRGPAAVEAHNVFYYCTYEGAVDVDAIENEMERKAVEGMISNFGQTPCQLLKEPHPSRLSAVSALRALSRTDTFTMNLFLNTSELKTFFEEGISDDIPIVKAVVPRNQPRSFISQGGLETLVTVSANSLVGAHGWLPYNKNISNYFTFSRDPSVASIKTQRYITGPLAPGLEASCRLYAVSLDGKLLFSAGNWDNSVRATSLGKARPVAHYTRHIDIVTCLALDGCGIHLVTGSRDTTCMVWQLLYQGGICVGLMPKPLQVLYGHTAEVLCVAISTELDMAVSGAKDGMVMVHTVQHGQYMRCLRPPCESSLPLSVPALALSCEGHVVVYSTLEAKASLKDKHTLHVYSVNGRHLASQGLYEQLADLCVAGEHVVLGSMQCNLSIRHLHSLEEVTSLAMRVPVHCVSVTKERSHVLVGLADGKLIFVGVGRAPEIRSGQLRKLWGSTKRMSQVSAGETRYNPS